MLKAREMIIVSRAFLLSPYCLYRIANHDELSVEAVSDRRRVAVRDRLYTVVSYFVLQLDITFLNLD
jgi:hypothetical protein